VGQTLFVMFSALSVLGSAMYIAFKG